MKKILVGSDQGNYSVTNGARTITLSGLSFTPTIEQLAYVFNKTQDTLYYAPIATKALCTLSGLVITIDSSFDVLATGDEIHIQLFVDERELDPATVFVENPDSQNYTSVEHIIDESDLGLDGTHDGGDGESLFDDTSETYTPESVAEGFKIYNITDGSDAVIDADTLSGFAGDGGAGYDSGGSAADPSMISHAALANGTDDDWDDDDVASIPECKRFVIPAEGYRNLTVHAFLDSQDEHNSCYMKLYGTLNPDADDTDDIYWEDMTNDTFGDSTITADGIGDGARAVTTAMGVVDRSNTPMLKYMIKIVAECDNDTPNNEFDVYIKKGN